MGRIKEKKYFFARVKEYANDHPFVKFISVFFIFLIYLYFSISKNGFSEGIFISLLTWSFFVFCTPIADAGILLDFPLRILTGVRMIYSESIVWILALVLNVYFFLFRLEIYNSTILLSLLKKIVFTPFPYWIIIILSAFGTFLSIHFGDELLDVLANKKKKRDIYEKHNRKHKYILFAFLLVFIGLLYFFLITGLGIKIPLF